MIFIWGTKGRTKQIDQGRFYCPGCGGERNYRMFKVSNYFTFFFVPILPLNELGRYVQCDQCHNEYHVKVLEENAQTMRQRAVYADAIAGMPLQMITNKLINAGVGTFDAEAAVRAVAEQRVQKQCTGCHLTYLADANLFNCTACGAPLR